MNQFKTGDLVKIEKLRNSPTMLVIGTKDKTISCLWFDKNDSKQIEVFAADLLKLVDTSVKSAVGFTPRTYTT